MADFLILKKNSAGRWEQTSLILGKKADEGEAALKEGCSIPGIHAAVRWDTRLEREVAPGPPVIKPV